MPNTWTYSGNPADSQLDEVRFWCQDVIEARPLLWNEEIDYLIAKWFAQSGSIVFVASIACEVIAAKLTAETSVSADGVSVSLGELQQKYITLAQRLRDQAKVQLDDDIDLSLSDAWDVAHDPSIPPLVFGIGFMDNWEVGKQDYGDYHPGRSKSVYDPNTPEVSPGSVEQEEDAVA